jgi:hypothetical protein
MEENKKHNMNDHDLLIRLDTKFDDFKSSMKDLTRSLEEKFASIFAELKNKADRHELYEVKGDISNIDNRLSTVENKQENQDVRRGIWSDIRAMGWKSWGFLVGASSMMFWIFDQITNK